MEELTVLKQLGKVKAPEYFEQSVMAELSMRKKKTAKARHLRLSLAGAAGAVALVMVVLNFLVVPQNASLDLSGLQKSLSAGQPQSQTMMRGGTIPITEMVNYSREIRRSRREPPTVYILEQVSNRTDATNKY